MHAVHACNLGSLSITCYNKTDQLYHSSDTCCNIVVATAADCSAPAVCALTLLGFFLNDLRVLVCVMYLYLAAVAAVAPQRSGSVLNVKLLVSVEVE